MTLATSTTAASSYANVLYTKGTDTSAEVILGKPACVESTWNARVLRWVELHRRLWASTKPSA